MSPVIGPVLVIGTGLIGTSIALSLAAQGTELLLEDIAREHVDIAASMGAGRALADDDDPAIVVVAVAPRDAAKVMADASARFPYATITDVTSVKERVLARAVELGADQARLVGGHPMAGREIWSTTAGGFSPRPTPLTTTGFGRCTGSSRRVVPTRSR